MTDTITIIRSRHGKRLAKLIRADGTVEDYDSAFMYDMIERPVAGLAQIAELLAWLMGRPHCAVVRGQIIDPARAASVRRLAFKCKKTGDEPTLRAAPHSWLALDMEGVDRPETVPAHDLARCAETAIQRLPAAFHAARCIVQASASHGIKPGCRLRLWYWLDRPAGNGELKHWLRGCPADPSVFRTVQPIYTAAPLFADGVADHLPHRMIELPGDGVVAVPAPALLAPPAPRPGGALPGAGAVGASGYALAALTNAAVRVRQAGIGQRHDTILREARSLARFIEGRLLTQRDVSTVLRDAGRDAGKPEDEIDSVIEWAMDHPGTGPLPEGVAQ
jgi:hypothetical protein